MSSVVVRMADAVVSAINAHDWDIPVMAERSYAEFDDQLTDLDKLQIDVFPKFDPTIELDTRGTTGWQVAIDVGVRKRFDTADQDQTTGRIKRSSIDELVALVESLAKYLIAERFTELDAIGMVWQSTSVPALFVRDHLRQWSQFTGVVRLTFSGHEVLA